MTRSKFAIAVPQYCFPLSFRVLALSLSFLAFAAGFGHSPHFSTLAEDLFAPGAVDHFPKAQYPPERTTMSRISELFCSPLRSRE
jgi:hypothetical protein